MERDGNGSRFCFQQEKSHGEYLLWLHNTLYQLGYCKEDIPKINTTLSSTGKLRYYYRFITFTYSSFNWIHSEFYVNNNKIIPQCIEQYLTPLALAVWLMDDGSKYKNKGIKFCTNCFSLKDVKNLADILQKKYDLKTSIHQTGYINQYNLYIQKSSMDKLKSLVKPFIHETMLYKIIDKN